MSKKHEWGTDGKRSGGASGLGIGGHEHNEERLLGGFDPMRGQEEINDRFDDIAEQAEKAGSRAKNFGGDVDVKL